MALQDDSIWVATTDSSVHRWPAEGRNPQKAFQKGGSFLAGNLSFTRARACLEGSTPVSCVLISLGFLPYSKYIQATLLSTRIFIDMPFHMHVWLELYLEENLTFIKT